MPKADSSHRFVIEVEGILAGKFSSIENFAAQVEVLEYKDGDDVIVRKRPGRTTYHNVTLKKGVVESTALWDWWERTTEGEFERKQVAVTLVDSHGREKFRWVLDGCWPCRWQFAAHQDEAGPGVMFEEITFVVERVTLTSRPGKAAPQQKKQRIARPDISPVSTQAED